MLLVLVLIAAFNVWSSHRFFRMDLTENNIHTLDPVTRSLVTELDKPLVAKVYFTEGLQAPYNNHQQTVVDALNELAAYSAGKMRSRSSTQPVMQKPLPQHVSSVFNPSTTDTEPMASELRKVMMGVALIYGEKQASMPAISQLQTLEYDLAKALQALVTDAPKRSLATRLEMENQTWAKDVDRWKPFEPVSANDMALFLLRLVDEAVSPTMWMRFGWWGPKQLSKRALYTLISS